MDFLIEVIWALGLVGVPIALFTLAMVWWALQRGHFKETLDTRALGREIKALSRNNKKDKKNKKEVSANQHPVQKKWARFGGGFYGIVAFFHLSCCRNYRNRHYDREFWRFYRFSETNRC